MEAIRLIRNCAKYVAEKPQVRETVCKECLCYFGGDRKDLTAGVHSPLADPLHAIMASSTCIDLRSVYVSLVSSNPLSFICPTSKLLLCHLTFAFLYNIWLFML